MKIASKILKEFSTIKVIVLNGYETFTCNLCNKEKHFAEFHKQQLNSDKKICKMCCNLKARKRYRDKKNVVEYSDVVKAGLSIAGVSADKSVDKVKDILGSSFIVKYKKYGDSKWSYSTIHADSKEDAKDKFKKKHSNIQDIIIK